MGWDAVTCRYASRARLVGDRTDVMLRQQGPGKDGQWLDRAGEEPPQTDRRVERGVPQLSMKVGKVR